MHLGKCRIEEGFWAEVVVTAVYLINRCPSTALGMKTPEKVWSGHPPSLDRLRVFDCLAYAHIRQDKVEPRDLKCMFLGDDFSASVPIMLQ